MKEFINKLIERLEEYPHGKYEDEYGKGFSNGINVAIKEVNELAEEYKLLENIEQQNNGWIPCSERLPEEHDSIFAEYKGNDKWRSGMFEKSSDDVNATIEYKNGTRKTKTIHTVDGVWKIDSIVKGEVIAWQPLPTPYKEGE